MKKPILLAVAGVIAGVAVAFGVFTFVLGGGGGEAHAEGPAEVVRVAGKLGPRITLADRVFNLLTQPGQAPLYLKLQTVVEFETTDPRWEHVMNGCDAHDEPDPEGEAARASAGPALVAAAPGGGGPSLLAASEGGGASGCEAEQAKLLAEFQEEIGSGLALIEDAVTTIVTGHTVDEIATPAGKEALKAEIAAAVGGLMGEPKVSRVLFLNFITQ